MPPALQWKCNENVSQIWNELLVEATQRAKTGLQRLQNSADSKIVANDIHPGALDLLEESLYEAGLQDVIEVHQGDCQDFIPPPNSLVVTNPPWGVRLTHDMSKSWESLRVFLRQNCAAGTEAWVLSGNKEATKHLGLRRSQSVVLQTGQQNLRWLQYKILDKTELLRDKETKPQERSENIQHERTRDRARLQHERTRDGKSQSNHGRRDDNPSRGNERRTRTASNKDKSVTKPLSQADRDERRNSWYI